MGAHALPHCMNVLGTGAAAAADQARALLVPIARAFTELHRGGLSAPLLGRRVVALARIRIDQERLAGFAAHFLQQGSDVLRRRAIDSDGGDLGVFAQGRRTRSDVLALAIQAHEAAVDGVELQVMIEKPLADLAHASAASSARALR